MRPMTATTTAARGCGRAGGRRPPQRRCFSLCCGASDLLGTRHRRYMAFGRTGARWWPTARRCHRRVVNVRCPPCRSSGKRGQRQTSAHGVSPAPTSSLELKFWIATRCYSGRQLYEVPCVNIITSSTIHFFDLNCLCYCVLRACVCVCVFLMAQR